MSLDFALYFSERSLVNDLFKLGVVLIGCAAVLAGLYFLIQELGSPAAEGIKDFIRRMTD